MGYRAPMAILLSHTSALEALRRLGNIPSSGSEAGPAITLANELPPADAILVSCADALGPSPTLPLHLLVAGGASQPRNATVVAHPSRLQPDRSSAFWIGDVACLSPARLCTQMAPHLSDIELTLLLFELMGTYSLRPDAARGVACRKAPLLTRAELLSYLAGHAGQPGVAKVRRCLARAHEGSASPRESKLALRLSLKPVLGGYGLRIAALNSRAVVKGLTTQEPVTRKPDILLASPSDASQVVALEYDGADHLGEERHAEDLRRSNELKAAGISEYHVDKALYANLAYMDSLVEKIRKELGIPERRLTRSEQERRRGLRHDLFIELEQAGRTEGRGAHTAQDGHQKAGTPRNALNDEVPLEAYGA